MWYSNVIKPSRGVDVDWAYLYNVAYDHCNLLLDRLEAAEEKLELIAELPEQSCAGRDREHTHGFVDGWNALLGQMKAILESK